MFYRFAMLHKGGHIPDYKNMFIDESSVIIDADEIELDYVYRLIANSTYQYSFYQESDYNDD